MREYFLSKIKFDPHITILAFIILLFGFAVFFSASLGVMVRYEAKFYNIIQNQFFFGITLGTAAFFLGALVPSKFFKIISPFLLLLGIIFCLLVFIPGVGIEHGGARRWISLFGISFQPSEVLKYSSILFLSSFYSYFHNKFSEFKYRLGPIFFLGLCALLVLKEPDLGTTTVILSGVVGVFVIVNARAKDLLILASIVIPFLVGFYLYYPHARERVNTFLFPEKNSIDQNFQVLQTKISLGSGGVWGDGYGKSIQKFHNLPEPIGDSIFAVIGEEFGFLGSALVLSLIFTLFLRLIYLASLMRDPFLKGVLSGTGIIIFVQTFLNAGSSSGAIPFTGVPLPLISHGSTSIIITMGMLGLCAQIASTKILHHR